jgi:hypothetical protein
MQRIPDWFLGRVVDGIQFLMALPLRDAPRHAPIHTVAYVWSSALWQSEPGWDERLDSARLYFAFCALAANLHRWPSPEDLLECLQPRPNPAPDAAAMQRVSRASIERRQPPRETLAAAC